MNKILIGFFKDHMDYTFMIYGSFFIVMLFIRLTGNPTTEVVYPFLLVTFIYVIFLIIRLLRYISFHKMLQNINGRLESNSLKEIRLSNEQKRFMEVIDKFQNESFKKINDLESQMEFKHKIISQMIHNIKTPTSVIDLIIQNSLEERTDTNTVLDKIYQENQDINENLNQLLSFLRLDHFPNDFSIEETDLVQQLRDIINLKKNRFIFNHVFPQILAEEDRVLVLTDKKWNRVLLDQLISNAIKYTAVKQEEKKVFFYIENNEKHVNLIIEDTGIGIPEYDLKRVFEIFFTGENGRRVRNSSGIGLHICKSIADKLNQSIEISSIEGKGTKVKVTYLSKL